MKNSYMLVEITLKGYWYRVPVSKKNYIIYHYLINLKFHKNTTT